MAALDDSNTVIVVFMMDGCGACAEFKPTLARAMREFPDVPVIRADASQPDGQILANKHGVTGTPTMLIMKRGSSQTVKVEGATTLGETRQAFEYARAHGKRRRWWPF